jgi:hypothetical protein
MEAMVEAIQALWNDSPSEALKVLNHALANAAKKPEKADAAFTNENV